MKIAIMQAQIPANRFIPHLPLNDAIQIQAAEYWLTLGEADEALRELEKLSETWNSPTAIKVRVAALDVLGERSGL
jgi:hypothetical protein